MSDEPVAPEPEVESLRAAERILAGVAAFASKLAMLDMKPRRVTMEIDGLRYSSTKIAASDGLDLQARMLALFGPIATRAIVTGSLSGISPDSIVRVADRAMRDGLMPAIRLALGRMEVDRVAGVKLSEARLVLPDFDEHFAGEYGHLLKVCAFALAHNLRGPSLGGR